MEESRGARNMGRIEVDVEDGEARRLSCFRLVFALCLNVETYKKIILDAPPTRSRRFNSLAHTQGLADEMTR
jgi:hypothetical protein